MVKISVGDGHRVGAVRRVATRQRSRGLFMTSETAVTNVNKKKYTLGTVLYCSIGILLVQAVQLNNFRAPGHRPSGWVFGAPDESLGPLDHDYRGLPSGWL